MKTHCLPRVVPRSLAVFALAAMLSSTSALHAADKAGPTPAAQYTALAKEFDTARQEFFKLYQTAKDDAERQKLVTEKYPQPAKFAAKFADLAAKNPKDPAAVDALVWIVTNVRVGKEAEQAIKALTTDHIQSEKLGAVCQSLMYSSSPGGEKILRDVLEKSPHRAVQGQACYSLARQLSQRSPAEAEKYFNQVIEKFGDAKHYRGTLGDAAKSDLFEMHNLAIGKTAPDIEGVDVDGVKFKLSDYRGKVVVIDFWGDW